MEDHLHNSHLSVGLKDDHHRGTDLPDTFQSFHTYPILPATALRVIVIFNVSHVKCWKDYSTSRSLRRFSSPFHNG